MSAAQQVGKLASRLTGGKSFTAWAEEPPTGGASGTAWEKAVIELAERGDAHFVEVLRRHVERGVIRSERATAALGAPAPESDAAT